jgi:hypothetical protein
MAVLLFEKLATQNLKMSFVLFIIIAIFLQCCISFKFQNPSLLFSRNQIISTFPGKFSNRCSLVRLLNDPNGEIDIKKPIVQSSEDSIQEENSAKEGMFFLF